MYFLKKCLELNQWLADDGKEDGHPAGTLFLKSGFCSGPRLLAAKCHPPFGIVLSYLSGVGQDFWVRPTAVEEVEAHNGSAALVLDMTFIFDGGKAGTITEVGKEGKPAEVVSRPHKYRAKYRFTVYPGKPYFASRFLWVENTDNEPWLLQSYFHYAPSNIAGDFSNDNPKLKYWLDAKANLCYGVEAPRGFNVSMWKDEAGAEHPDVYRYPNLERTLKPGERFASDDAPVYVISGDEDSFARTADEVRTSYGLTARVFKAETVP